MYNGRIFDDMEDAFNMMVFSLGSWIAVITLLFSDDD
jgi:hypothetical protein